MKQHTVFGYQRLTSIVKMSRKVFLVLAAALAENHHENGMEKVIQVAEKNLRFL